MDYAARLADDSDPLLRVLRAARSWRVAPTVVLGQRPSTTYQYDSAGRMVAANSWTTEDTELMLALDTYEAGLCPGCQHPLSETSKVEHDGAYRAEPPIRCHYCAAHALVSETAEKQHQNTAGLLFPITLNPAVVEINKKPVPPLPPGLRGE